jgi:phosphoadenosine phosphosulfate reductase
LDTTAPSRAAELERTLAAISARFPRAALASSFGFEDMVLVDAIARRALPIDVITLDTGRLPGETHALIDRVRERYGIAIDVWHPDGDALRRHVALHGQNGFYAGLDARHACCAVRKSAPLARALAGRDAWITGLRRAQSVTRTDVRAEEFDALHAIAKLNPLVEWSEDEVRAYIAAFDVPYNPLHDRGYPSIGCAPCTRAVQPGEDVRAGRWWWENADSRECGLHRRPLDVAVRVVATAEAQ